MVYYKSKAVVFGFKTFRFLKSILFNKFIISSHAIFYKISSFWEYEELKWFTDITEILSCLKITLVILLFAMNEDIGTSLHGPTKSRDAFETGFEVNSL